MVLCFGFSRAFFSVVLITGIFTLSSHGALITEPKVTSKTKSQPKVQLGYFPNWVTYDGFQPTDLNPKVLTHIAYAFANIRSDGTAILSDMYADTQKIFPGDNANESGNNLFGCLKQLYLLKLANRNLKVILSVGGWSYSEAGAFNFLTNATQRAKFVSSAVQLTEDYGLDGFDLDFEYPANSAQGSAFASLVSELRTAYDTLAKSKGDTVPYIVTAAVSAGSDGYGFLDVKQMDSDITFWNLMAYDYAGSWLTWSDNQANLYGGARTGVNTDQAVKWYLANGATASKINMGIPLYGRSFENTAGLGKSYSGVGPGDGVYNYADLPLSGSTVVVNTSDVSSYSYDSKKEEFVSFDVPQIVTIKAQYVASNGLAGQMFWDLSTDKSGSQSLVSATAAVFSSLDQTKNHINFPSSKFDNIRNNMGQKT